MDWPTVVYVLSTFVWKHFAQSLHHIYRTTSQCLSSYGCTITTLQTYVSACSYCTLNWVPNQKVTTVSLFSWHHTYSADMIRGSISSQRLSNRLSTLARSRTIAAHNSQCNTAKGSQTSIFPCIQWSLSIVDSIGTKLSVLYREVPLIQRYVDLYTAPCGLDCRQCPH